MIACILLMALANISLGFAVAVYLGRWCQDNLDLEDETPLLSPAHAVDPTTTATAVQEPSDASTDLPDPEVEQPAEASSTPEPSAEEDCSVSVAATSFQELRAQIEQYDGQPGEINAQVQACATAPEAAKVEAYPGTLGQSDLSYQQAREEPQQNVLTLPAEQPQLQPVPGDIQASGDLQVVQTELTHAAIEPSGYQGDLQLGYPKAVDETAKLPDVSYRLHDAIDEASASAASSGQRPETAGEAGPLDELTGITNRVVLEAGLVQWWEKDPHRTRQLCVGMIDVDQFAKVNDRFGQKAGDRVLHAVAQLLTTEARRHDISARCSGQRFLVLFPEADIRTTTNIVERIRQTIETSRLRYQDQDIQITVSCGVTEATSADTSEAIFSRAEATLAEAKRYGRNRTFIHEGKYPTPVVPPNFPLEERTITI